ncbi:hypothetical protein OC834_005378 [Tilletia horrida]|uniref:Steroid 5-alpha reductase C-terminal domain-containing protein n=1 Tax=Tilletia horrida TaxID=155126 RepID=A0AAN6GAM4_9BASI|nr:hypothetical protein OC834_005378 [Tilletia horrida]KAK0530231.1 hypothetical protein OC842_003991 [Tilletia horrida]KAK0531095.1 hypothetical protein OC835_003795 [Tilletia horrida]KAK0559166.1 hypothetical protein OC844_004594 [Tilletia horrida]
MVFLAGLRTALGPTVGLIFAVQALGATHAIVNKTERFYDLFGSIGFSTAALFSLYAPFLQPRNTAILTKGSLPSFPPPLSAFHPRQLLMTSLTVLWAARLGSFLFARISKEGKDSRFDGLRDSPVKFAGAWTAQAIWITLTALPLYMVNSIPKGSQPPLGVRDYVGLGLWVGSFLLEVVADRQKSAWRQAKKEGKHDEPFISSGLWSIVMFPNYLGEISLHSSEYIIATTALAQAAPYFSPGPALAAAALGPVAEALLIRYVSGVSMQLETNNKKFKDEPRWKAYKEKTPLLIPVIGAKDV